MANHAPVKVDPKALEHSEQLWANFLTFSKWGIIALAILLVILAGAFVPFSS